jgi:hypothetical protein
MFIRGLRLVNEGLAERHRCHGECRAVRHATITFPLCIVRVLEKRMPPRIVHPLPRRTALVMGPPSSAEKPRLRAQYLEVLTQGELDRPAVAQVCARTPRRGYHRSLMQGNGKPPCVGAVELGVLWVGFETAHLARATHNGPNCERTNVTAELQNRVTLWREVSGQEVCAPVVL